MKVLVNQLNCYLKDIFNEGIEVNKYADPTEGERLNLSFEEAADIDYEECELLWIDSDDLDKLDFRTAQYFAATWYGGVIHPVGDYLEPEVVTILDFGDYFQAWDESGLVESGDRLSRGEFVVEPGMIGDFDISSEDFYSFCDDLQDIVPGIEVVGSYSTQGRTGDALAHEWMEDSLAWERALETAFDEVVA